MKKNFISHTTFPSLISQCELSGVDVTPLPHSKIKAIINTFYLYILTMEFIIFDTYLIKKLKTNFFLLIFNNN
jgi:hypothetical protein